MPIELPVRDPCPFCRNLAGEVSEDEDDAKRAVYIQRDELAAAFVNPFQSMRGACLVIPTRHAPTILDLSESEA